MSFFAILSFIPFMLFAANVIGYFLKSSETGMQKLTSFIANNFPGSTGAALDVFNDVVQGSAVYGIIGLVGLAWAGLRVFETVEYTVNRIWRGRGKRSFIQSKLVAAVTIPIIIVFVVVSISLTAFLQSLVEGDIPFLKFSIMDIPIIGKLIAYLLPVPISTMLFTWLYFFLPNRAGHLRSAFYGGLLTSILWEIAKIAFDAYIKHFGPDASVYGSFTSAAVIFLWVYYSSIVVIAGCEFGSLLQHIRENKTLHGYEDFP